MFCRLNNSNASVSGILCYLLLGGCSSLSEQPGMEEPFAEAEVSSDTDVKGQPVVLSETSARPTIELTEDILFKVIVAEVAGQRGKINIAIENYLELARTTRDRLVIERAVRIAIYARDDVAATEAARLWIETDPDNADAHQVLTIMELRAGNIDMALAHVESMLLNSRGNIDQKLWMIANFLGREEDQSAVMALMEQVMEKHMDDTDAIYAYAHVAARFGNIERSQELLKRVLEIEPGNEVAAMTYLSLLQKQGNTSQAIIWLEEILKDKENDFNLRQAYARLLTDAKRFDDARRQFEILIVQAPNNVDILYALGLLYLQIGRLDDAETYFLRLSELRKRVFDANYYLGRIAEERKELQIASDYYQGVYSGDNYLDAEIRLSLIMAKEGKVENALSNIRAIEQSNDANRLIIIQAEGEILTDEKRYQEALDLFNREIDKKSHPDLLYSRAMLAEKMDRLDILEQDLKAILVNDPDNATVLNALGYTLADRTERYEEAYEYIKRAYELNSGDFYILDSMGWVFYRLGRLEEAVNYLRRAMQLRRDPEIAAHLGEVLWVMGDKKAAREVWDTALQNTPTDDRLLKVIERFKP